MSFTALRDAAALPPGASAHRFFRERLHEVAKAGAALAASWSAPSSSSSAGSATDGDATPGTGRLERAARLFAELARSGERALADEVVASSPSAEPAVAVAPPPVAPGQPAGQPVAPGKPASPGQPVAPGDLAPPPVPTLVDGVEHIEGEAMTLLFDGKKCIHSRFCVTGAPQVFLANVKGPWIRPDAMRAPALVEIAHACPSGAIAYRRKDGQPDETAPPVNLISVREAGPYAVRGALDLDGRTGFFRATLCRCGASKNKPYCDNSHHEIGFSASGEPATTSRTDMLPVRDGPLTINPQTDGPLSVRGNLEITSGTGRVVARLGQAKLCRCGASNTKPFCDGSHARVGFRST
jgi:CDGSH-type Zn-finger protein/uncharacterized Fe-S cluster protein YjdI